MTRRLKRMLLVVLGALVFAGAVLVGCVIRPAIDPVHATRSAVAP